METEGGQIVDALGKPYLLYKYNIYPRTKDIRGFTRLKDYLGRLAELDLEKVNKPTPIYELDFDTLVILDACRLDLMKDLYGYNKEINIQSRTTVGSHTRDFIEKTFTSVNMKDTVVVTANPHYHNVVFKDVTGRRREEVFEEVFDVFLDGTNLNDSIKAENVVKKAKKAKRLYPNKKLLVHMMQPHHPFIGSNYGFKGVKGFKYFFEKKRTPNVWSKAERGLVDESKLWRAYKENLEYGWNEGVVKINELVEGKTVVTSDHGNMFGENGLYGHLAKLKNKYIRKVPLIEMEDGK